MKEIQEECYDRRRGNLNFAGKIFLRKRIRKIRRWRGRRRMKKEKGRV